MEFEGMNADERHRLLERYRAARAKRFAPPDQQPKGAALRRLDDQIEGLREEYAARLPRVALSRCPYCQEPLRRAIDPYGLDGPWWLALGLVQPEEPAACEHFAVLLGALNLRGREPREVEDAVEPGPEVPFVIPRLLALPGMRAVASSLTLAHGDVGYPIAYFGDPPPPSEELHQPWARRSYQVVDADGKPQGFSIKSDPLDVDLGRWLETGALQWIAPDDAALALRTGKDGCPYLGLRGDPRPQEIQNGRRGFQIPPDGRDADPFD